jgi:hypothetical protein
VKTSIYGASKIIDTLETYHKTAITFAYDVGLKSFLYEKVSEQKLTSKFNHLGLFGQFLESSNSKGKMDFFAL